MKTDRCVRWRGRVVPLLGALALPLVFGAGAAAAATGAVTITRSGRIGSLHIDKSSLQAVERVWGKPAQLTPDICFGGVGECVGGYYTQLGYNCTTSSVCQFDFYIARSTGRLESFSTTSAKFRLFGGVRAGMSAELASERLHKPDIAGCGQGISLDTSTLSVSVGTVGGKSEPSGDEQLVRGGKVTAIDINDKRHDLNVGVCL